MKRKFLATALATSALSLGLAGPGKAVVVWSANVDIPIPTTFDGVYVDLDTGGGGSPVATGTSPFAGADANFFFGGFVVSNDGDLGLSSPTWQPVRVAADNAATIANIPFGDLIAPAAWSATATADPLITSGTPSPRGLRATSASRSTPVERPSTAGCTSPST